MRRTLLALALLPCLGRCATGAVTPAAIDPRNDTCAWCRMAISDPRFAAQLVSPGEEPRLFDDIGCLRDHLASGLTTADDAVAFVADHRTRAFVVAGQAVYLQLEGARTPMASGLVAWSDASSRAADPDSRTGIEKTSKEIFGSKGPPGAYP